jgi:phage N-6-adenine-methyltransferase
MAIHPALFSSKTDDHATPRDLAARYIEEFGIETDVCASAENAVVSRFYSREQNGLLQQWTGVCWMNPPYGREISHWIEKASNAALAGATVVCLLPARTDTRWWHEFVQPVLDGTRCGEVRFIKGRLKFGDATNCAPFPSVVVVFAPEGGHA